MYETEITGILARNDKLTLDEVIQISGLSKSITKIVLTSLWYNGVVDLRVVGNERIYSLK